jgi:DNA mismatch repair protein MutS
LQPAAQAHDRISKSMKSGRGPSLLWPDSETKPDAAWLSDEVIRDLGLAAIVQAMCSHALHREAIEKVLYRLCAETAVITYRQAILADLLRFPALAQTLHSLLPQLDELTLFAYRPSAEDTTLHEVTWRSGELELLVDCLQALHNAFVALDGELQAEGLIQLRQYAAEITSDPLFQQMRQALPDLLKSLRTSASITLGVNLDAYLRPEEAILLSVNSQRFSESGLLDRIIGRGPDAGKGIGPLHKLPMLGGPNIIGASVPLGGPPERAKPLMIPLFRDLSEVLDKVAKPIARQLEQYVRISAQPLVDLRPEIIFYVYAAGLAQKLAAAHLPTCRPEIAPLEERVGEIVDGYNLHLALHLGRELPGGNLAALVLNDVILGGNGRIVILTGPNRGGKTTYLQAVGQTQVLAQAGLFVPGRQARISPVDNIFSHFPVEERLEPGTGRFGDEASRIREIFNQVTRYSLVLLNETLSTTNASEGLYLARDIVRMMRRIGLRAIYTTHLHELAASAPQLNEAPGDSKVVSMVASAPLEDDEEGGVGENGRCPYKITLGPPAGHSYAERIATRYGIAWEQLIALLEARHILDPRQDSVD